MKVKTDAISKAPLHKNITVEDDKRVFVVGDLDGDFTRLKTQLDKVNFNPEEDVLFSLGDIIDRGEDSAKLVDFMKDIGAHAVLGNHEHMMLEALLSRDSYAMRLWTQNGGMWHQMAKFETLVGMCKWFLQQPLAITLNYGGKKIGISHTLPPTWSWEHFPGSTEACVTPLLWDRERFTKKLNKVNHGVDFSIHGHNSTQEPVWIGNSLHIDTSYYGMPTVLDLAETIETDLRM
ncbi:metallophosphoesterase [Aestuariibacter sp. A3R04]|uniref:metallophosphoesterase n=1 Tax=Aestuariibacter sp. A3R04 TaxID=2841571 RepID=UPI001C091444|nr:metallophosphoesterase [Aestuariibacter sp. A3R04]MBU3023741.1 metallophosphoesterase [Aestuariibacter sp. A3R04]